MVCTLHVPLFVHPPSGFTGQRTRAGQHDALCCCAAAGVPVPAACRKSLATRACRQKAAARTKTLCMPRSMRGVAAALRAPSATRTTARTTSCACCRARTASTPTAWTSGYWASPSPAAHAASCALFAAARLTAGSAVGGTTMHVVHSGIVQLMVAQARGHRCVGFRARS